MKLEQACKFRTDQYRVCSRSEGFTPEYDSVFDDHLHDTMNTMFAQLDQSVLTCVHERENTFLAMSTMRTDVHGRLSMFTNAWLLPGTLYGELVTREPAAFLAAPVDQMMTSFDGNEHIPQAELLLADPNALSISELRKKYGLSDERYTLLLALAYQAVTEGTSLCLRTTASMRETPRLVREFVYLIDEGLPPMLRRQISFSSGPDTRMTICVRSSDCGRSVNVPDALFTVEAPGRDDTEMPDERTEQLMTALVTATDAERTRLLEKIESFLQNMRCEGKTIPSALPAVGYYFSEGIARSSSDYAWMLNTLLLAGKRLNTGEEYLNNLLIRLAEKLAELGRCPTNLLEKLLDRSYTMDCRPLDEAVFHLIQLIRVDDCTDLASRQLGKPYLEKLSRVVSALLDRVPCDRETVGSELTTRLLKWALNHDIESMVPYCVELLRGASVQEQRVQLEELLYNAQKEDLSDSDSCLITGILSLLTPEASEAACVDNQACAVLDDSYLRCVKTCSPENAANLQNACFAYLIRVRLCPSADMSENTLKIKRNALDELEHRCKPIVDRLWEMISDREHADWELVSGVDIKSLRTLMESYLAIYGISKAESYEKLITLSRRNYSKDPRSDLEVMFLQRWIALLKQDLSSERDKPAAAIQISQRSMDAAKKAVLSLDSSGSLRSAILKTCWRAISLHAILLDTPESLIDSDGADYVGTLKRELLIAAQTLRTKHDTLPLCNFVMNQQYSDQTLEQLTAPMVPLMTEIGNQGEYFYVDLLLLACMVNKKGRIELDLKKLSDLSEELEATPSEMLAYLDRNQIRIPTSNMIVRLRLKKLTLSRKAVTLQKAVDICLEKTNHGAKGRSSRPENAFTPFKRTSGREEGDSRRKPSGSGMYFDETAAPDEEADLLANIGRTVSDVQQRNTANQTEPSYSSYIPQRSRPSTGDFGQNPSSRANGRFVTNYPERSTGGYSGYSGGVRPENKGERYVGRFERQTTPTPRPYREQGGTETRPDPGVWQNHGNDIESATLPRNHAESEEPKKKSFFDRFKK